MRGLLIVAGLLLSMLTPATVEAAQRPGKAAVGIAPRLWNNDAFRLQLQYYRLQQQQTQQNLQLQQQLGAALSDLRQQNHLQQELNRLDLERAQRDWQLLQNRQWPDWYGRPHYGLRLHGQGAPLIR